MTTINSRQPDLNATNAVNLNDNSVESLNKALKKSSGKMGSRVVVQFGLDKFVSLTKKEAELLTKNPSEFAKLQKFNSFKNEIENNNYCKLSNEKIANIKSRLENIQSKLSEYNQKEEVGQRKFHLAGTIVFDENSNIKEFKSDITKHPPDLAQVRKINKLVEKYTDLPVKNENTSIKGNYLNKKIEVVSFARFFKISSLIRQHSGIFKKKSVEPKPLSSAPLAKKVRFSGVAAEAGLTKTISKVISNMPPNPKLESEPASEKNASQKIIKKTSDLILPEKKPETQSEKLTKDSSPDQPSLHKKEETHTAPATSKPEKKEELNWQSRLEETLISRTSDSMAQLHRDLVKDLEYSKITPQEIIDKFTKVATKNKKNMDNVIYTTLVMIDRAVNKEEFMNGDLAYTLCFFMEQDKIWKHCPENFRKVYFSKTEDLRN